jgi:hypothetical protein
MKSKLLAIIAIAVLSAPLSNVVTAETPQWFLDALKVDNPNELAIWGDTSEKCLITTDELKDIVSGVLTRSRIEPLTGEEPYQSPLYLNVKMSCIEREEVERYQILP